jgi:alkylated DNA repair dioxygenase AlkB
MRFRKYRRTGEKNRNRDEVLSVELLPRSVYLLSDAARETWQHSIPPVKEFRYAIMIRTMRGKH